MKTKPLTIFTIVSCATISPFAEAETIVQTGTLNVPAGTQNQIVSFNQFDTLGGTRQLNSVQLDFLTTVSGSYQTIGLGIPISFFAKADADWFFNSNQVGDTQAVFSTSFLDVFPGTFTFFNADTDQAIFNQQADLLPWIGTGQTSLTATTKLQMDQAPLISFTAVGTAKYTVTYDFTLVPGAPSLAFIGIALIMPRRRRTV
jgi:hypothetical protein